jgi:hypothetical protein
MNMLCGLFFGDMFSIPYQGLGQNAPTHPQGIELDGMGTQRGWLACCK